MTKTRCAYIAYKVIFRSAEELSLVYAVSTERLLAYAARGNLAMCRTNDALQFDERGVARLFPRRGEPDAGLGALGRVCLGTPPAAAD